MRDNVPNLKFATVGEVGFHDTGYLFSGLPIPSVRGEMRRSSGAGYQLLAAVVLNLKLFLTAGTACPLSAIR